MAVDLSLTVPLTSLSSLFEVGVGTNLGLVLIDGAKKYLTIYGEKVIEIADGLVDDFLPVLEADAEAASAAVKIIQGWSRFATAVRNLVSAEEIFFLLKFLCVLVALAFVCLLGIAPFVVMPVSAVGVLWVVGFSVFPVFAAGLHLFLAVVLAVVIYLGTWALKWRYKPLIDTFNEIAGRSIPVE